MKMILDLCINLIFKKLIRNYKNQHKTLQIQKLFNRRIFKNKFRNRNKFNFNYSVEVNYKMEFKMLLAQVKNNKLYK